MYEVTVNNEKIGYIKDSKKIEDYIKNKTKNIDTNVAFVEINCNPEMKLNLVNKDEKDITKEVINLLDKNTSVEYTTYAITYNGKNKTYVATEEDANKVISKIKENTKSKNKDKLGILQVYSNNLKDIKAVKVEEATKKIEKVVKSNSKDTIKVAKVSTRSTINGIKFTVKPLSGTITSRFGYRNSPGGIGSTNHKGLDISGRNGTTIKSAAGGTVIFAGYKGSLGNLVIIDSGKGVKTYYGHCSKLYVSKGQKVKAGEKIAAVGQTGAATGPHLHFEVRVNGTAVNPQRYLY